MRDVVVDEITKELSKKYNKNETIVKIMLEKYINLGYNIKSFKKDLKDFYKNCY